jgi:hypothetical protein
MCDSNTFPAHGNAEEKDMAPLGIKPQLLGCPDHSLITIPTTLSQLLI